MFPSSWLSSLSTASGFFPEGLAAVLNRVNATESVLKNGPARDAFLRDLSLLWSKYAQGVSSFNPTLFAERLIHPWLQPNGVASRLQQGAGAGGLLAGLAMCVAGCGDTPIDCAPENPNCDSLTPSSSVSPSSTESPTTTPEFSPTPSPTVSLTPSDSTETPSPVTETDTPDTATETPEIAPTPSCFTEISGELPTAPIDCAAEVILLPESDTTYLGPAFSAEGDFFLVPRMEASGYTWPLAFYLLQSPVAPGTHRVQDVAQAIFRSEYGGHLLHGATLADLDRDGALDIVLSGSKDDYTNDTSQFGVHVFFDASNLEGELNTLQVGSAMMLKEPSSSGYSSVYPSSIGDFNGDGDSDFVIAVGSSGTPVSIFTQPIVSGQNYDIARDASTRLAADDPYEYRNYATESTTASLGDVNGDGFDDFIIGGQIRGSDKADIAQIVLGGPDLPKEGVMTDYSVTLFSSESTFDNFGNVVGAAGDVNGDGLADLFIRNTDWTSTYLVFGARDFAAGDSYSTADLIARGALTLFGENTGEPQGIAYASMGDIDQDGKDDVLIANAMADGYHGAVYAVHGADFSDESTYADMASLKWSGPTTLNDPYFFGQWVWPWDFNQDGKRDFVASGPDHIYMTGIPQ